MRIEPSRRTVAPLKYWLVIIAITIEGQTKTKPASKSGTLKSRSPSPNPAMPSQTRTAKPSKSVQPSQPIQQAQQWVDAHNKYRLSVGINNNVSWHQSFADRAVQYARNLTITSGCNGNYLVHSDSSSSNVGENLKSYAIWGYDDPTLLLPDKVVGSWVSKKRIIISRPIRVLGSAVTLFKLLGTLRLLLGVEVPLALIVADGKFSFMFVIIGKLFATVGVLRTQPQDVVVTTLLFKTGNYFSCDLSLANII